MGYRDNLHSWNIPDVQSGAISQILYKSGPNHITSRLNCMDFKLTLRRTTVSLSRLTSPETRNSFRTVDQMKILFDGADLVRHYPRILKLSILSRKTDIDSRPSLENIFPQGSGTRQKMTLRGFPAAIAVAWAPVDCLMEII